LFNIVRRNSYRLLTYSADILNTINVPNPSEVVKQEVGTSSVAEAAAIYRANNWFNFIRNREQGTNRTGRVRKVSFSAKTNH
jgi:cobalt-precorrin 5A hydrolase/precorrin-3B C17-methyltransferase